MKKNLTILVTVMLFSVASALAQSGQTGPLTWILEDNTLTISGEGAMPDYDKIEPPWWIYRKSIHAIVMENGVTTIGYGAFQNCSNTISVAIPNSVTAIKDYAFYACLSLPSIAIPNGVTSIGDGVFFYCESLISINIPNGVTSIGYNAFTACISLVSVTIPNSVTIIKNSAFGYCTSLPSITIPGSVITIEDGVFYHCPDLASVTLSNGLKTIGAGTFGDCESLTSITIPSSVTKINYLAFFDSLNLTSIDVENENNTYTSEDGILFNKDKTTLICCPPAKETGVYVIPNHVTTIGGNAFASNKSLTSIIIPNGVRDVIGRAFDYCTNLTSATLPNSILYIGYRTFSYCSNLTSIVIPNGVMRLQGETFSYCTSLTSVTIPKSVLTMHGSDFAYCSSLTSITNLNPVPIYLYPGWYIFSGVNQSKCTLTVPTSAVSAYQNANVWKEFNIVGGGIAVNPTTNINRYGYTMGEGLYEAGDKVGVMAVAYDGYKFINWTKDGVEVSDRELYIFTVTEDVELIANFERDDVGIEQLTMDNGQLKIYPNPTTGELTIDCNNGACPIVEKVEIFDVFGKMVMSGTSLPSGGLGGASFPTGVYFIRITTKTETITKKIIKQ